MLKRVSLLSLALCSAVVPARVSAQQPQTKPSPASAKKTAAAEVDPMAEIRRTTAVSLVNTLADEARMFRDPNLRGRVQARSADALWDTDRERARLLFRRAWDDAEAADADSDRRVAEERARQTRARGSFSIALGPSLRTEVLRLAAKRDRALGEEFLAKLEEARRRELESPATSNERPADAARGGEQQQQRPDPMDTPPAVAKRLRLAIQLLEDGDTERAIQFADPALGGVTPAGLEFLARLRAKSATAADERYAAMLGRAAANPASDANTVSLLSSYLFTPSVFTVFSADAGSNVNSWARPALPPPADAAPQLRAAYFRAAAAVLLRPTPTPEQDHTSSGRAGWYMVIARLLPLFDQHAPERAAALRAKMASLAPDTPDEVRRGAANNANNALTRGIVPEDPNRDRVADTLSRLDRAKTAAERDAVYIDAALDAMRAKDPRAEEFLNKVEDADARQRLRAFMAVEAAREAVNAKDAAELVRIARGDALTSFQRAWALTEAARLVSKDEPGRAVELLDEAQREAREHIDPASKERVSALVAVATQLFDLDRARAWEVMLEVVKASNAAKEYSGEDGRVSNHFETGGMTMRSTSTVQSFDLGDIFSKLAREDLQRAADLARAFDGESPRSFATLAVARTVLEDKDEKKPARAAN